MEGMVMNMRDNKGISLIALIIVIVIVLILIVIGVQITRNMIDQSRTEEIKTNMLAIRLRAGISVERYESGLGYRYGTTSEDAYSQGIEIPSAIRERLVGIPSEYGYIFNYRIVLENDLRRMGLGHIIIDVPNNEFFVIDYNVYGIEIFYYVDGEIFVLTELVEEIESEPENEDDYNVEQTEYYAE